MEDLGRAQSVDKQLHSLIQEGKYTFISRPIPSLSCSGLQLWYENTDKRNRLYIPHDFRRKIVDMIHSYSHPGIRNTTKQVMNKYIFLAKHEKRHEILDTIMLAMSKS